MDDIALAYEVATRLWDEGRRGPDGVTVLALTMGIYLEAQEGGHRGIMPVAKVVCEQGTAAFDQFRLAREAKGGIA